MSALGTRAGAKSAKTVDFGAPTATGEHVFRIEIPTSRKDPVLIVEDFGFRGQDVELPDEPRAVVRRAAWTVIADAARRDFNDRLRAAKQPTGRWHSGSNLVERLLGKELCVLAWAAETASPEESYVICSKWAALRPEERWWLFTMTVAEAGLPEDTMCGWRRALYHALSDGERPARGRRRLSVDPGDFPLLPLFEEPS